MYFPILSCGIQKVGACLFPKQRWPAPRAFREKSTWFWCTSQGRHCHYGSYPGRKRSTANRQRNRTMDRHHGGMVKVCLKIPEQLGGLSSFVMFPYVSICFHTFPYVSICFHLFSICFHLFSICYKKYACHVWRLSLKFLKCAQHCGPVLSPD